MITIYISIIAYVLFGIWFMDTIGILDDNLIVSVINVLIFPVWFIYSMVLFMQTFIRMARNGSIERKDNDENEQI